MAADDGVAALPLTRLSEGEALALIRRVVGVRGIKWPEQKASVRGVGGFTADLTEQPGPETVVWATFYNNDGVLGLFQQGRLLAAADQSLAQILRVQPIQLPGLPHFALMVDDVYDALFGAFMLEERRRLYVWDRRRLRQVFQGVLRREEFESARWRDPGAPARWYLYRTTGELTLRDGVLIHTIRRQELEAPGNEHIPSREAFRVTGETTEQKLYRWNARLRRFEPGDLNEEFLSPRQR